MENPTFTMVMGCLSIQALQNFVPGWERRSTSPSWNSPTSSMVLLKNMYRYTYVVYIYIYYIYTVYSKYMNPNLLCHSGCTYTNCISYPMVFKHGNWTPYIHMIVFVSFRWEKTLTSVWWHRRVLYMFWIIQVYHCCCYTYFTHNVHHTHIIHTCIL